MHGVINLSVQGYFEQHYGPEVWQQVLEKSGVERDFWEWTFSSSYPDSVTVGVIHAGAEVLGVSFQEALHIFGAYFVPWICSQGYEKLLRCLGSSIPEFVNNLNNLHLHVTPESLELHYESKRGGLGAFLCGLLQGVATTIFHINDMEIELLHSPEHDDWDHEDPRRTFAHRIIVYLLRYPYQTDLRNWNPDGTPLNVQHATAAFSMGHGLFNQLFPFHLVLDQACHIVQMGDALPRLLPGIRAGAPVSEFFEVCEIFKKLRHPYIPWDFEDIKEHDNTAFILRSKCGKSFELKGQMVPTSVDALTVTTRAKCHTSNTTSSIPPSSGVSTTSSRENLAAAAAAMQCPFQKLSHVSQASSNLDAEPTTSHQLNGMGMGTGVATAPLARVSCPGCTHHHSPVALYPPLDDKDASDEQQPLARLRTSIVLGSATARSRQVLLFLGSPIVANLNDMTDNRLYLSDIPLHDKARDLVLMNQHLQSETEQRMKLMKHKAQELSRVAAQLYL